MVAMENAAQNLALDTLKLAVTLCGTQAEFARRIGCSTQAVWQWINRDKRAPVDACPFIEAAVKDERVTCERLRPDYRGFEIIRDGGRTSEVAA